MPATLRRHPSRFVVLAAAAGALALPAAAQAANPLAGARLTSAVGKVKVVAVRCPPGIAVTSPQCGRGTLELTFTGTNPKTRRIASGATRIAGKGRSECTSESPIPEPTTLPDGSMQLQGAATYVKNSGFASTNVRIRSTARSTRWTWLEPTSPTVPCNYFFGEGTTTYPEAAISPRFTNAQLRKRRFAVTLAANVAEFEQTAPDGSKIFGDASWNLRLNYRRG